LLIKSKMFKQNVSKDFSSQDSIESMRSWVRKIEQSSQSLSSRLAAVEKRISSIAHGSQDHLVSGNILEGPIEKIFSKLRAEKKNKDYREISKILDKELSYMYQTLCLQHQETTILNTKLDALHIAISEVTEKLQTLQQMGVQMAEEIDGRVQKLEVRKPPMMKLGNLEIPLEITGILGGFLAFLIAILVWLNQTTVVLSPWFLTIVGLVFLGSAMFKTFHIGSVVMKPLKSLSSEITEPVEDNQ